MQSVEPEDFKVEPVSEQLQDELLEHLLTLKKRHLRSPLVNNEDASEIHAQVMDDYAQAFENDS
jgi:hypothetical protein